MQNPLRKKIILFDIDYTLFNTALLKQSQLKQYEIYEESKKVLEELSKVAVLGIISEGETTFQKSKLEKTNILPFFNEKNIHIISEKKENLERILSQYSNNDVFFVDDKLPMLQYAKTLFPSVYAIWIKRGVYAENQKPIKGFSPNKTIQNLKELIAIIQNLN